MKTLEEIVQKWEAKAQKIIAGLQTNYNSDQIRRLDSLQGCIKDLNDCLAEQANEPKPMQTDDTPSKCDELLGVLRDEKAVIKQSIDILHEWLNRGPAPKPEGEDEPMGEQEMLAGYEHIRTHPLESLIETWKARRAMRVRDSLSCDNPGNRRDSMAAAENIGLCIQELQCVLDQRPDSSTYWKFVNIPDRPPKPTEPTDCLPCPVCNSPFISFKTTRQLLFSAYCLNCGAMPTNGDCSTLPVAIGAWNEYVESQRRATPHPSTCHCIQCVPASWQPIDTAPKTGETILVITHDSPSYYVHWYYGAWRPADCSECFPTHWLPTPQAQPKS